MSDMKPVGLIRGLMNQVAADSLPKDSGQVATGKKDAAIQKLSGDFAWEIKDMRCPGCGDEMIGETFLECTNIFCPTKDRY